MSDVPADPPITYVKKQYTTIVAERVIDAPRQVAWDAMLALLVESTGGYVAEGDPAPHGVGAVLEFPVDGLALREEVISMEPPWRRVYELTGAPVALYQGTAAFTDQGGSCLLAWSLLIDPLPDGASDAFIAAASRFVEDYVDRVKSAAEAVN